MSAIKASAIQGACVMAAATLIFAIGACTKVGDVKTTNVSTSNLPTETATNTTAETPPSIEINEKVLITSKETTASSKPAGATPVDLTRYYGMKADNFDKITTFPWPGVPRGHQEMAKVPFEIGGALMLWGERNQKMGMNYPERFDGIPVHATCETIYVLHSVFFEGEPGTPIFSVVMNYADGTSEKETLLCGSDGRDWFANKNDPDQGPAGPRSILGWSGDSTYGNKTQAIRFCLTAIANPHSEKQLATLDLVSAKSQSAACILAITVGKADLLQRPE